MELDEDYSMLDGYLERSAANYRKNLLGERDEQTGYYSKVAAEDEAEDEGIIEGTSDEGGEPKFHVGVDLLPIDEDEVVYNDLFGESAYTGEFNTNTNSGNKSLRDQLSALESGGDYKATNPNSSATGKYQFLWGTWGDSIKKVTGVKDQKEFLNNPSAQEQYYSFYERNVLLPEVRKIKSELDTTLNDTQLAKLVHFRGTGGARKYLKGQVGDKPEAYNMPTSKYIRQAGGIATTLEEQYIGLNDPSFDSLIMPMYGSNVIRGLDSGEPVFVTDDTGKRRVLRDSSDTDIFNGNVYERRLKR